jgi:hypothetical protein
MGIYGVTMIGQCYSPLGYQPGQTRLKQPKPKVLNYPKVAARIALATPRVWKYLNHPRNGLIEELARDVEHGTLRLESFQPFLTPKPYKFKRLETYALRFYYPLGDELGLIQEAERLISSPERSPRRQILFQMMGIRTEGLDLLSAKEYSALLGKLFGEACDCSSDDIAVIRITDRPVDTISNLPNGEKEVSVSRRLLQKETRRAFSIL